MILISAGGAQKINRLLKESKIWRFGNQGEKIIKQLLAEADDFEVLHSSAYFFWKFVFVIVFFTLFSLGIFVSRINPIPMNSFNRFLGFVCRLGT